MPSPHYRHTQVGWVTVVVLTAVGLAIGPFLWMVELRVGALTVAGLLLLSLALFWSLTVAVNASELAFSFGIGLIRKRVALMEIRHYRKVRNPWYYGWGIHFFPGGVLYNVSGFEAVELSLANGKRLRVGTDEPEALCRAIERVVGKTRPFSEEERRLNRARTRRGIVIFAAAALVVIAGIAALFYAEEQPPRVSVDAAHFRVDSFMYGEEYPLTEITHFSLHPNLPRIRVRTNGYALGATLRGHFRLDRLGEGQLFVELGHPPYLLVEHGREYVVVNFENPDETQRLFETLKTHYVNANR
jgi:hypothetical protein